jgi:hypothetical protein
MWWFISWARKDHWSVARKTPAPKPEHPPVALAQIVTPPSGQAGAEIVSQTTNVRDTPLT